MIYAVLVFWILSGLLITWEKRIVRLLLHLGIFSLISAVCFMLLGAPDVAMAEAVISAFSTVIFIVSFEKYYSIVEGPARIRIAEREAALLKNPDADTAYKKTFNPKPLIPMGFAALLALLFILSIPDIPAGTHLRDMYLESFKTDIGGENAVTSIYLGYRVYDTLFEALLLLASIVAILHLSVHRETYAKRGRKSEIRSDEIANVTIRIICPVLLLFNIYLIANGHISPGGGFQGGVMAASFFVCRYLIHDIYDMHLNKVLIMEKLVFVAVLVLSAGFVVMGMNTVLPISQNTYLMLMNLLVGVKVACGFLVMFYRFIVFERR
jgi:multicomponent Na+:H+ antiporter subunit B